jgi:hypothetical protein
LTIALINNKKILGFVKLKFKEKRLATNSRKRWTEITGSECCAGFNDTRRSLCHLWPNEQQS